MPDAYALSELRELKSGVARGSPRCPRCGGALDARSVPPRSDVSYVRDRVWLTCTSCDLHGVVDRPRSTHPSDDRTP